MQLDVSGATVPVIVERAPAHDPRLAELLVAIDLQTFAEGTFTDVSAFLFARHGATWWIRAGDRPVAFALVFRDVDDPTAAVLLSMGIVPGWRGLGLGPALLQAMFQGLPPLGFRRLVLHVGARNVRALKVYQDAGFVQQGEEPDLTDGDTRLCLVRALGSVEVEGVA
jgi:GNAT superfamily N-acetyltransferase